MPPGSTSTPSHTDEKSVETQRAKGYSKKFLSWLELMVLGSMGFTKPDQLVCGRIRLSAQASIRNDDLRRTPSGRIEWVYDPLGGEHRDGTSKLLWQYGITTADKLYTRIPSTEALESFLTNKVRLLQGRDQGEGNYGSEDRDMPEEIGEYVMSEESGNMRRLWEACKTVSTDDIRAQARGSNLGGNETRGRMVVEDLFRRATEAGLTFSSDKTKPGPKTVQNVVKNLSTNGDFIHMEWELYNNEADELRALRQHRARQAGGAGSVGAKITPPIHI